MVAQTCNSNISERLRQEDHKFKASPSSAVRPYLDGKKEEDPIPTTMKTLLIHMNRLLHNIGLSFLKTVSKENNQTFPTKLNVEYVIWR